MTGPSEGGKEKGNEGREEVNYGEDPASKILYDLKYFYYCHCLYHHYKLLVYKSIIFMIIFV